MICIPVNVLLVALFRNIKPTPQHPNNNFTFNHNEEDEKEEDGTEEDEGNKKNNQNGHKYQMITSYDQDTDSCIVSVGTESQSSLLESESEKRKVTENSGHSYQMITSYDMDNDSCRVSVAPDSQMSLLRKCKYSETGQECEREQDEKVSCFKRCFAKNKTKKKEPKYLPQWVLYPAWALNIMVVLGCGFMVIWYGMAFGNKKSLEWLTSVTIGLVSFVIL